MIVVLPRLGLLPCPKIRRPRTRNRVVPLRIRKGPTHLSRRDLSRKMQLQRLANSFFSHDPRNRIGARKTGRKEKPRMSRPAPSVSRDWVHSYLMGWKDECPLRSWAHKVVPWSLSWPWKRCPLLHLPPSIRCISPAVADHFREMLWSGRTVGSFSPGCLPFLRRTLPTHVWLRILAA